MNKWLVALTVMLPTLIEIIDTSVANPVRKTGWLPNYLFFTPPKRWSPLSNGVNVSLDRIILFA
jgi:hypothetical protein